MKLKSLALIAAASVSLAACSGAPEEQPVETSNVTSTETPEETPNIVSEAPAAPIPVPVENRVEPEPAPTVTLTDDEQAQDDAAATGMTAKVNRDDPVEGQPVQ